MRRDDKFKQNLGLKMDQLKISFDFFIEDNKSKNFEWLSDDEASVSDSDFIISSLMI